ncbi:MAG: hypothetical protein IPL61_34775 [Myxococcales bacterium]|nr:hypothetical protein [Myxococcales bacterium]
MRAAACALALVVGAGACGSFEDPTIIIDLRPVAVVVEPPEQVVDVDPANPLAVTLSDVRVCAVVAEPQRRPLAWTMMVCPPQRDLRCTDLALPFEVLEVEPRPGAGDQVGQEACATIPDGPRLGAIVRATIEHDSVGGFGGVDINLLVRAVPIGAGEDEAVYAGKGVRFSARVPAERVANTNPVMTEVAAQLDRGSGFIEPIVLPSGGCRSPDIGLVVPEQAVVKLAPRALEGSAETYVVPTFEGGSRTFTENLRYQWLATAGSWSRAETGGPRDAAGNPPVLSSEWSPPTLRADEQSRLVDVWVIQRDERGGVSWLDTCFIVVPPGRR